MRSKENQEIKCGLMNHTTPIRTNNWNMWCDERDVKGDMKHVGNLFILITYKYWMGLWILYIFYSCFNWVVNESLGGWMNELLLLAQDLFSLFTTCISLLSYFDTLMNEHSTLKNKFIPYLILFLDFYLTNRGK